MKKTKRKKTATAQRIDKLHQSDAGAEPRRRTTRQVANAGAYDEGLPKRSKHVAAGAVYAVSPAPAERAQPNGEESDDADSDYSDSDDE